MLSVVIAMEETGDILLHNISKNNELSMFNMFNKIKQF